MADHPRENRIQNGRTERSAHRIKPAQTPILEHPVTIEYMLTLDDFMAFYDFHHSNPLGAKKPSSRWPVLILVLLLTLFVVYLQASENQRLQTISRGGVIGQAILVIFLVGVIGFLLLGPSLFRWLTRRSMKNNSQFHLPIQVTLTTKAIEHSQGSGDARLRWEGVIQVAETKTHLFIYTTANQAVVVPAKVFSTPEEFYDFADTAHDLFEAANPPLEADGTGGISIKKNVN